MSNFSRGSFLTAGFVFFIISLKGVVTESKAWLQILPQQPVQIKAVGTKALLTCQAVGDESSEVRDIHWLDPSNRTIGENHPYLKERLSIEKMQGDNALGLIFQDLQADESGLYTCAATYSNSETLTASASIVTIVPISWVDAPTVQNPIKGKEGKIKCRVHSNPSPNVNWIRNGLPIISGDRHIIESDGLIIKNVQESDDGLYTCRAVVILTGEYLEKVIRVEVHSPPVIDEVNMIKETEVTEGDSAKISCTASAKPPPVFVWIKESTKQNLGVGSERFSVNEHTGLLTLNQVNKDDNGEYKCIANNPAGSVETAVIVTVIVKPKIFNLRNVSVAINREAKLECQASGNPLPTITFRKLSSENSFVSGIQPRDSRISVDVKSDQAKGEITSTLSISQLRREDDGLYACTATNRGGSFIKNGHITVEFPPSFNHTPIKEAWSWNRIPINLTCLAESIPNATITWQLNNRDIDQDFNFKKYSRGPESTLLVTPTDFKFYGHYKCIAKNVHGDAFHIIELKEAHAPSAVQFAKATVVTANTINFEISGPNDHGGQKIKAYIVQYKEERESWQQAKNKTWSVDSTHILENLVPKTRYNFRFAAINEVGEGPFSAMLSQSMPETSAPQIPTILTQNTNGDIVSPYSNMAQLRWRIPANNGSPINKYTLLYCMVDRSNNEWSVIKQTCKTVDLNSAQTTFHEIKDLRPDTTYKVEVRAQNYIGYSQPAEVYLRTAKGAVDSQMHSISNDRLSTSVLVLVVVAALFGILVIVDVSCYFVSDTGFLYYACSSLCGKRKKKHLNEDDPKLGSLYSWRFPLPYCNNRETSSSDNSSHGNCSYRSNPEKLPLPDMNFVFEAKELLNGHRDNKIRIDSSNMLDKSVKKNMQVEYDLKKSISKTSFIGKDSAV